MSNDDARYEESVLSVAALVSDEGSIKSAVFITCHIKGPAVLYLRDSVVFQCRIGDPDAVLWEIAPGRKNISGAVLTESCHFEGCSFENVGFAGPPALIAELRGSVR